MPNSHSPPAPGAAQGLDATQRLALAKALDLEICDLHRRRNSDRVRIVARVAALKDSGGYRSLDFSSVQAYAWKRLGWGASKVKSLLTLHGRLPKRPLLREAFESGEIDWSKAVLVGRASEREPEREADWLRLSDELSSRELEARVTEAGRGTQDAEGERELRRVSKFELSALEEAMIEAGFTALRSEGLDLERGAALAELVRRALQGGSVGSSRVRFLLDHCPDCRKTSHPTVAGNVPVKPEVAERLRCDSETHDVRVKPARVSSTIPPSVKNEVQARSKGICEYPGCTNTGWLDFHHGKGRGAGHDADTIFQFCSGHHRAPHEGDLRIEGSWSTGVRFLRADGSLIGTAGGPAQTADKDSRDSTSKDSRDSTSKDSRESMSDDEPALVLGGRNANDDAGDDARRDAGDDACRDVGDAKPFAPEASVDPSQGQDAFLALRGLGFRVREAKPLLRWALAEQPAARAEDLVRAVLLRHGLNRSA